MPLHKADDLSVTTYNLEGGISGTCGKLRKELSILGLLWFGHKINFLTSKEIEAKEVHGSFPVNMEDSTEGCLAMRIKHASIG